MVLAEHGLPSFFEALTSDAVFTIAHSMLYVGASLGYSFKSILKSRLTFMKSCLKVAMAVQNIAGAPHVFPVGVVGVILRLFLRAFNMVFFPQLLAMTGGLTVAMGLACLTGIPRLFAKIYRFVTTHVIKGVIAAIKYAQGEFSFTGVEVLPKDRLYCVARFPGIRHVPNGRRV